MTPKEKAQELFEKFIQYEWRDEDGYMQNDEWTKKEVELVIDVIEECASHWGVISVKAYWRSVRKELSKL